MPVLENTVGIFNEQGELEKIQGYIIDISKLKEQEKALKQAYEKALESDRLKSAFLANMSHELRTPLNHIVGFAHILKNTELTAEQTRQLVDSILNSGQALTSLLSDIIDLSKIEARTVEIKNEPVDIHRVIREILNNYAIDEKIKSGKIELLCPDDISQPFWISADEFRLKQVFNNLISNALKFTPSGTVKLFYKLTGRQITFTVEDTGIGIKPQHQKIIFERFRQVDTGTTRRFGGAGLGLSISKALVNLMGGDISLKSTFGMGSSFSFTIPYVKARPVLRHSQEPKEPRMKKTGKLKILIVDDDPSNRALLRLALKHYQPEIIEAADGLQAIDAVKNKEDIDLILMDLKMPNMSGYVATREIKRIKPDIKVAAQTAYAMAGDKERALNAGCDYYLTKPLNFRELKRIIKEISS